MVEIKEQSYTIRRYRRGEEQKLADLVNAGRTCDWEVVITEGIIQDEWNDPRLELERDTWAAVNEEGEYIAATEAWFEDPADASDVVYRHIGFTMRPAYREEHVELMEHLFEQAVAHVLSRPMDAPGKRYYLRCWAAVLDEWKHEWILDHGFQHVHSGITMLHQRLHDLLPIPSLDRYRIEEWVPERDADLWRALNKGFSTDEMFTPLTWEEWQRLYHSQEMDEFLWRMVIDTETDEVVGLAIGEVDEETNRLNGRRDGWVTDIAVIPEYRGRGLGRAVLLAAMHALRDVGMTGVKIGIDTTDVDNATRLYDSLGFQIMEGSRTYRRAVKL